MIDIWFPRENLEAVKGNIRKKFQKQKLSLVDKVAALDGESRKMQAGAGQLRSDRNKISRSINALTGQGKKDEAEKAKEEVTEINERLAALEPREAEIMARIQETILTIPQVMDPSVPIGKDDSCNIEAQRYDEPVVPGFKTPYHADIVECLRGTDLRAAGKVVGSGFYYLLGDIARLHSAVLSYARGLMIGRGFTYVISPYMIHSDVVTGVVSFPEIDVMIYKIEDEDLYLIGAGEHSMIGHFIDNVNDEAKLPYTLTFYSPCFHKGKGAHGIEERGVYRIRQFEKQEMIVICKPEESMDWYNELWQSTVDFFRSLDIPVRTLGCCSGDFTGLRVKSCDMEAWGPHQKKYFEMDSCSSLGDVQARRLHIRAKGADGKKYLAHTLNNACVAPPRMLVAFLKNNLQADGSARIPEALRPYMGNKSELRT